MSNYDDIIQTNVSTNKVEKTKKEEEKYLAYIEKESIKNAKHTHVKPHMVNYKNLGELEGSL